MQKNNIKVLNNVIVSMLSTKTKIIMHVNKQENVMYGMGKKKITAHRNELINV